MQIKCGFTYKCTFSTPVQHAQVKLVHAARFISPKPHLYSFFRTPTNSSGGIFFGSDELTRYWAPTILKAPHAFFSCMCLGASHLDIMRGLQDESLTTISLKSAVIQEINSNLVGPANKVTDLTLIAISQIVAAEVVNGDQHALRIHTKGLEMIVQQRGGLQNLGMHGLVAIIVSM